MSKAKNLLGQKFGRLTVIERAKNHIQPCGKTDVRWLCRCDCGNEIIVRAANLKIGHTKSCGCLQKENVTTHGLKKTRLYTIWRDIKIRCYNPNAINFKNYGGNGIVMCDEWKNDFKAFYDWCIANGYNENAKRGECTIDRIDNSKGYSPDNCRCVDNITQQNNKKNNRFLTYNNQTYTIAEWSRILNIHPSILYRRLYRGWSVEKILSIFLREDK